MSQNSKPVIIRKVKKVHGGGHHGGSWKVAYADFVTAMMAFFMVMWILGMDQQMRSSVEAYFANPAGVKKEGYSAGGNPLSAGFASKPAAPAMPGRMQLISRAAERDALARIGERVQMRLRSADGLQEIATHVEIVMSEQGLRIELMEDGEGETFFAFGDARVKPAARRALAVIAAELGSGSEPVAIEGHTDAAPFGRPGYTNWELSADRANAARRELEGAGLRREQIIEIRGYADRKLRVPDSLDPSNRRISILLPFTTPAEATGADVPPPPPGTV